MKSTLLALVLTAFMIPAISHAHGDSAHKQKNHKHFQHMIEKMDQELDLSDEQRSQVETLFKEQHAKHKALRDETRGKLNAILSDDQQTKLETLKAERKARWQEKREAWREHKTSE